MAGAAFGLVVVLASPHRGTQAWVVWASLAIALAATSGAVFGYGLTLWPEITGLGPIRLGRVAAFVAQIAAIGCAILALGAVLTLSQKTDPAIVRERDLSGLMLTMFAGLAAVPVGAGLGAIRERARAPHGTPGEQVEQILALNRLLARLLGAFGALVALATLALGAALRQGIHPQPESAVVIIFGAAWSVVVACAYAPAAGALREAAQALCRTVVPLGDTPAADLPSRTEDRRQLEQALGVDRGVLAGIQSGLIIFAPLLASTTTVFLPG
ncbi:hypothetical protein [Longispora albida]|uniref:hypothetical protein n=1 Tax=Longispora albida TaxID=203523 RepID=UPI000379B43A|nr:hypothetical protein [Longispora albida]